jgi:hypothetical protein
MSTTNPSAPLVPVSERLDAPTVSALRDLQRDVGLLKLQRELIDARAEAVELRRRLILQAIAARHGFVGEVRLDLDTGLVTGVCRDDADRRGA